MAVTKKQITELLNHLGEVVVAVSVVKAGVRLLAPLLFTTEGLNEFIDALKAHLDAVKDLADQVKTLLDALKT